MTTSQGKRNLRIGLVGFGEAGRSFAGHFSRRDDVVVKAFDTLFQQEPWAETLEQELKQTCTQACLRMEELVADSDLVFSLVTPSASKRVAEQAAQAWPSERVLFIDLNTSPPTVKAECARLFETASCYVDGAILDSFRSRGPLVPIVLAGPHAERAAHTMCGLGLNVRFIGPRLGAASAIKMCRSVFMKGVECLFVESLLAAQEYGSTREVLASIEESITSGPFGDWVKMLVTTHAVHAGRRGDEMEKIVGALQALDIEPVMSKASRDRLLTTDHTGIREHFDGHVPDCIDDVITALRAMSP